MRNGTILVIAAVTAAGLIMGCASNSQKVGEPQQAIRNGKVVELETRVNRLESEKQIAEQRAMELERELRELAEREKIYLEKTDQYALLRLPDKLLYASGKARVTPEGQRVLTRLADILKKYGEYDVRVEGHTDNIPIKREYRYKYPTNWELSTARATGVVGQLVSSGGIDPRRISAVGRGEYNPIASNATDDGRAQNRRVELYIAPALPVKPMSL
ncbi:MAG TPA: flagellar motor protein MotB [Acidobacteriota bacterium]|nr:flagellar motor protein MotB [Acidobacteriota bacterium]